MHHIRSVGTPLSAQNAGEGSQVGEDVGVRERLRRAGLEVVDRVPGAGANAVRPSDVCPSGEDGDVVSGSHQGRGQFVDVQVLCTGCRAAHRCEWIGVHRHHGDLQHSSGSHSGRVLHRVPSPLDRFVWGYPESVI